MKIKHTLAIAALMAAGAAQAGIIGFEGLTASSESFTNLGIANTYEGYSWSSTGSAQQPTAWGAVTGNFGGLSAHGGSSYAWTFNGGQSMFVDFGASTDVVDVFVAGQFGGYSAASVQLFGYDAADVLTSQSVVTNLAVGQWSHVVANLNGIHKLEFRSDAATRWFGIDDLQVNPGGTVPEPSTLALVSLAVLGVVTAGRRRR